MNEDELETLINETKWLYLGSGGFNLVGYSETDLTLGGYTGKWIYKIQKKESDFSKPDRVVAKWNLINPGFPAFKTKKGWIAPYVGNQQATDEQIAKKLIEIYRGSRHIIVDACVQNNFLQFQGETICVDFDMAVRRNSFVSSQFYRKSLEYNKFFEGFEAKGYTLTVACIKNLLYLESCLRYRQIKDDYLSYRVISLLTDFRLNDFDFPLSVSIMEILTLICRLDPDETIPGELLKGFYLKHFEDDAAIASILTKEQIEKTLEKIIRSIPNLMKYLANQKNPIVLEFLLTQDPALLALTDGFGCTLMHFAALYNNTSMTTFLLGQHISLSSVNAMGLTAIDMAISLGSYDVAQLLYEAGDRVSPGMADSKYNLFFAVFCGLRELVESIIEASPDLLQSVDNLGRNALYFAVNKGHTDLVHYLIIQGVEIRVKEPDTGLTLLDCAVTKKHTAIMPLLKSAGLVTTIKHMALGNEEIHQLIEKNDYEHFKLLIEINPSVATYFCSKGYLPIHYAAAYGQVECVQYLIEMGIKPESPTKRSSHSYSEMTVLDIAILNNRKAVVEYLSKNWSLVPHLRAPRDAMFFAVRHGLLPLLKQLIDHDRELVNIKDEFNQSPLLHAAALGHQAIVVYLIHHGSALNESSQHAERGLFREHCQHNGYTPLDWAIYRQKRAVVETLKLAGARADCFKEPEPTPAAERRAQPEKKSSWTSFFNRSKKSETNDPRASCASRVYE